MKLKRFKDIHLAIPLSLSICETDKKELTIDESPLNFYFIDRNSNELDKLMPIQPLQFEFSSQLLKWITMKKQKPREK